jgi:hypothetical protein
VRAFEALGSSSCLIGTICLFRWLSSRIWRVWQTSTGRRGCYGAFYTERDWAWVLAAGNEGRSLWFNCQGPAKGISYTCISIATTSQDEEQYARSTSTPPAQRICLECRAIAAIITCQCPNTGCPRHHMLVTHPPVQVIPDAVCRGVKGTGVDMSPSALASDASQWCAPEAIVQYSHLETKGTEKHSS